MSPRFSGAQKTASKRLWADAGLRVSLLYQGNPVRVASPSGKTAMVDWDTRDLLEREVALLVEDRSATGGLALDDLVAY